MEIKVKKRLRSIDEVLRSLLGVQKQENTQEAVETVSKEEESDSNTSVKSPRSQAIASAVENRSPLSVTESAHSQAGTDASVQPRKRRWSFCPQCLNMYDHQGKCPYCGVDLIPLDTDENKKLYLKLKQERGRG